MRKPAVRKRAVPEADIQRDVVRFLRLVLPPGAIVHHCANDTGAGGRAGRNRQAVLVGMGVYPGFADLVVLSAGQVLFLEVKSQTGRLRPSQVAFRDAVLEQGFGWALVRSMMVLSACACRFLTMGDCNPSSFSLVTSLTLM